MAVVIPVPQLIEQLRHPVPPVVLDVRRAHVFAAAPSLIAGAGWRDPRCVGGWSGELDRNRPIVVYCAYGHAVSQSVADALAGAGLSARYLEGGIAGLVLYDALYTWCRSLTHETHGLPTAAAVGRAV